MKVTVVPAQVTTVEDRIAGSLGMSQLLLLALPVFGGCGLFVVLPPIMHGAAYKLFLIGMLAMLCCILAIRIKGKLILFWLIVILRYRLRPRYYVFNKNSLAGREQYKTAKGQLEAVEEVEVTERPARLNPLATSDLVHLNSLIDNPAANLSFKTTKGGLRVLITEVKD